MFISQQYNERQHMDAEYWDAMLDIAGAMHWIAGYIDWHIYRDADLMLLGL